MTTVRNSPLRLRSNFRNLYLDVFWFGVLAGSTAAFITIYATRLGASTFQISLFTAGPAVVNLLFSLPAGQWLVGRSLVPTTFWSALLHRFGYLILIPVPWLFSQNLQVWVIVGLTLLMAIPGTLLAISFNALFAEAVPAEWRAEVVGKRNAILAVSMTVATLLCGQLLDWLVFPLNYGYVFVIGAIGAGLSTYYLSKLRLLQEHSKPSGPQAEHTGEPDMGLQKPARKTRGSIANLFHKSGQMLPFDMLRSSFGLFMLSYMLFYAFQSLGAPLFPIVQVRTLGLSDGMISLGSSLFYGVMLLVSLRMVEITTRLGHKRTLATGATLFGFYPLFLGLAQGPALFWVASFIGGGAWGITNAGLTNRLMEKVPDDQRPAGMALHNVVLNIGILLGSLAAPLLGNWMGPQSALFVVAGLRFLAGGLFWIWG